MNPGYKVLVYVLALVAGVVEHGHSFREFSPKSRYRDSCHRPTRISCCGVNDLLM
jgi:hypothetical protein